MTLNFDMTLKENFDMTLKENITPFFNGHLSKYIL